MKFETGFNLLSSLSNGAKSAAVCSFLLNPMALKASLGKNFPYNSLLLLSGEKSIDIEESIKTRKFLDSSSIPLMGHSFHSKLYLFEKSMPTGSQLDLIIASFNSTSAGLGQNFEFWSQACATINTDGFNATNIVELMLSSKVKIDAVHWTELCSEKERQLVVAPALEVLWRLVKNGAGLAPGKPRCIPDVVIAKKQFPEYDSIFVHTLGNNSLSKALELMIREATDQSEEVTIRIVSPYHNIEGIRYLHKKCVNALGKKNGQIRIELLTVFPPDFSEKFSNPQTQPFASFDDIKHLSSKDPRINLRIKLWKKETAFNTSELDGTTESALQNVFLHAKAILVKSERTSAFLLGSPNLTDAAIGPGPGLNFEAAVWERRYEVANSLWARIDSLFQACQEAEKEDFDALRAWSNYFKSDYEIQSTEVRGARDAIDRFLAFYLEKGGEQQKLYPYEETPIFFDEAENTTFNVELAGGAPKLSHKATVYVSPSNLEETKTIDAEFIDSMLSSSLPLDTSKPDTISIRIDIESKLIEERQVEIKQKSNRIEVVTFHLPMFDQESEEAFLLVNTEKGPKELRCHIENDVFWIKYPREPVTKKQGLLRLYSKSLPNNNSFGYFRIRCRKRPPKFELKVASINPFPMSIYFKEHENPLAARILPESIDFSILTSDDNEIPAIFLATKRISESPLIQSTMAVLPSHIHDRIRIETKFADEHEGYYVLSSEHNIGYSESTKSGTKIYIPRGMAEHAFTVSEGEKNKISFETHNGKYASSLIPLMPSFVERDNSSLFLSCDPIPQICAKLLRPQLILEPAKEWISSYSPINVTLSHLNLDEKLKSYCDQTELNWSLRSLGQEEKGQNKNQPFKSPSQFTFLPEEIKQIKDKITGRSDKFGEYLDLDIQYQIKGGHVCQYPRITLELISTNKLFKKILEHFWSLLKSKEPVLITNFTRLFHSYLSSEVPFDTFQKAIKGEEISREILVYKYQYSPLVRPDGYFEFTIKQNSLDLLTKETCKMIVDQAYSSFSADSSFPKISGDVFVANLEDKIRQIIEPVFSIRGERGLDRIVPAKLFERIYPSWRTLV